MALDEFTRQARKKHLGSSDAAAVVLGTDPWGRTKADLWLEKTGRLTEERGGNAATSVGQYLEHGVLDWTEAQLGTMVSRDQFFVHPNGVLCANLDGLALGATPPAIVEAKTAGLVGKPHYFDDFGEPGTDQIPEHVLIQVHHQLAVVNAQGDDLPPIEWVLVPALLVGRGFVLYRVARNPGLEAAITEAETQFWQDHVVGDRMPEDVAPSLDVLRRVRRDPAKVVPLEQPVVDAWLMAKAETKAAEAREREALEQVLGVLADAEAGAAALGTFTYLEQTRKEHVVREATFRVARWKPTKPAAAMRRVA